MDNQLLFDSVAQYLTEGVLNSDAKWKYSILQ